MSGKIKITHIKTTESNKYPKLQLTRDPNMAHMYSFGEVRILTSSEYDKLRSVILQERHKILLDVLLITGMRYVEVVRLWHNPKWYNESRNIIHLPQEAQRKSKRSQQEITIHPLPTMFNYVLKNFWAAREPPSESSWNRYLRKWAQMTGIAPYGLSAKTTRKTLESWCVSCGMEVTTVCLRQGHDSLTSMRHYQGLAFSDEELNDIKKKLVALGLIK